MLSLQHDDCLAYWAIDYAVMQRQGMRLGLAMTRCPIRDFDIHDQRERSASTVPVFKPEFERRFRP